VRYAKLGKIRWTSQRDVARMWERALRRAGVPVAYTAGFSPRPRLSFGLALPTGCESLAEYLDIDLAASLDPGEVTTRVETELPPGLRITASAPLQAGAASLQQDVTSCAWAIEVPGADRRSLEHLTGAALAAPALPVRVSRKGREEDADLRPAIRELRVRATTNTNTNTTTTTTQHCVLEAEVATRPRGVRPSELCRALGIELARSCRTHQWIEKGGSRTEPLSVDAALNLLAEERAS